MPLLPEISLGAVAKDDQQKQLDVMVRQLNEWGRLISNESRTWIVKDETNTPRIIFGLLPDNTIGLVISKEDVDVQSVFN